MTVDEIKRMAIKKLCDGCVKSRPPVECGKSESVKFYSIDFSSGKPCSNRRKIPENKK